MKLHKLLALSLVLIFALSCKKEKEADAIACYLDASPSQFTEESISVTYTLKTEGEYTVTLFYYYDESGRVEINNPSSPQEITVVLSEQKTLLTGARGNVKNGFIEVEYVAVSAGSTYNSSSKCEQISQ